MRRRAEEGKAVAVSEDAKDRRGGANRGPGVQKQSQASARDGINRRGHKQFSLYLKVEAMEGDNEEEVEEW